MLPSVRKKYPQSQGGLQRYLSIQLHTRLPLHCLNTLRDRTARVLRETRVSTMPQLLHSGCVVHTQTYAHVNFSKNKYATESERFWESWICFDASSSHAKLTSRSLQTPLGHTNSGTIYNGMAMPRMVVNNSLYQAIICSGRLYSWRNGRKISRYLLQDLGWRVQ